MKKALFWTFFWISLALLFNLGVWIFMGHEAAANFLSGYLLEKSLSVDNLFVFLLIFKSFKVSAADQHRMLRYGIWGAIILRGIMILVGVALVQQFSWILYLFGAFLLWVSYKMAFTKAETQDPHDTKLYRFLHKHFRLPLFWQVVLIIEFTDLLFATDSIPAIFAILGLRALYFVVADLMQRFAYLHYGLALILGLVGIKLLLVHHVHISPFITLSVIGSILTASIIYSIKKSKTS